MNSGQNTVAQDMLLPRIEFLQNPTGVADSSATSNCSRIDDPYPHRATPLLALFALRPDDFEFIGFSQSHVYRSRDRSRIVRIAVDRHVTSEEIEAETAWITLLSQQGLPVCKGIPSREGRACAVLELNGMDYLVCCFEHAPGGAIQR